MKLILENDGHALVIETDGDRVSLESTHPAPPGSPLSTRSEQGVSYRIKVRGCRRVEAALRPYRIDGRFVNLSRSQRMALTARAQIHSDSDPRDVDSRSQTEP